MVVYFTIHAVKTNSNTHLQWKFVKIDSYSFNVTHDQYWLALLMNEDDRYRKLIPSHV